MGIEGFWGDALTPPVKCPPPFSPGLARAAVQLERVGASAYCGNFVLSASSFPPGPSSTDYTFLPLSPSFLLLLLHKKVKFLAGSFVVELSATSLPCAAVVSWAHCGLSLRDTTRLCVVWLSVFLKLLWYVVPLWCDHKTCDKKACHQP